MAAAAAATASSDSASPQCEGISGLHLIRNRTLRPLALAASQPFHFMSPIPCSDFIYLHGDSNKIKKKVLLGAHSIGGFLQLIHSQSVTFRVKKCTITAAFSTFIIHCCHFNFKPEV